MLLMSGVSTSHVVDLKRDPLLNFQIQKLRPKRPFSHLLLPPLLPTDSSSSSQAFTTFALFKSKTKAPPKKVSIINFDPSSKLYFQRRKHKCIRVMISFNCLTVICFCLLGCRAKAKGWRRHLWHLRGHWLHKAEWALCGSRCHDWLRCEYIYIYTPSSSFFLLYIYNLLAICCFLFEVHLFLI